MNGRARSPTSCYNSPTDAGSRGATGGLFDLDQRWRGLMLGSNVRIVACPPDQRPEALEVLYQELPPEIRAEMIAMVLGDELQGQVDLSGLWIAKRPVRERPIGAILSQRLAGRAVVLWPPEINPVRDRDAIAAMLIRGVLDASRADGAAIVQAVLDDTATPRNRFDLTRGGLPHVTDLIYMRRDLDIPWKHPRRRKPPKLQWRGLDEGSEDLFRKTLGATYPGSLDMPELEGARTLDDVMASHRASGRFIPKLWRLGTLENQADPSAILILSPVPDRDAWEVVYLGLVPEARGRGLGAQTLAHARDLALQDGHPEAIDLAVDTRNAPALKLYESTGFIPHDQRSIHLVVFRGGETGK